MTLPGATLFPQALLPLYIFEPRYRQMLRDVLHNHRMMVVAMQKPGRARETPRLVAGLGLVRVSVQHKDGTSHLILQGLTRVELNQAIQYKPYRVYSMRALKTPDANSVAIDALVAKIHELVSRRIESGLLPIPGPLLKKAPIKSKISGSHPFSTKEVIKYLEQLPGPEQVADLVSCALLTDAEERQAILETVDVEQRLRRLVRFLVAEMERSRKQGPG